MKFSTIISLTIVTCVCLTTAAPYKYGSTLVQTSAEQEMHSYMKRTEATDIRASKKAEKEARRKIAVKEAEAMRTRMQREQSDRMGKLKAEEDAKKALKAKEEEQKAWEEEEEEEGEEEEEEY